MFGQTYVKDRRRPPHRCGGSDVMVSRSFIHTVKHYANDWIEKGPVTHEQQRLLNNNRKCTN